MSRVQLALNVDDLDTAIALLLEAVRDRAGEGPARLRELRDRRTAAQARAHRGRRRGRHAQSPRRRGRVDRRGGCRAAHGSPASGWRPRPRTRSRVATRCRTRCGSTVRRASRGRSTRCSPTSRCRTGSCARERRADALCCGVDAPSPPSRAADRSIASSRGAASAEAVGTALLVAIVVGSGIAAQRLSPNDVGLQLLENSVATGARARRADPRVRAGVGRALQPGRDARRPAARRHLDVAARACTSSRRVAGGVVGVMVANLMFGLPAVTLSTHARSSGALWLGEVVATFGLLLVILGVVRAGRGDVAAVRSRRLHRGGVLVHVVDELREPGRDDRAHVDRTRSRASRRAASRCSSSCRSSARSSQSCSCGSGTRRCTRPISSSRNRPSRSSADDAGDGRERAVVEVAAEAGGGEQHRLHRAAGIDAHASRRRSRCRARRSGRPCAPGRGRS